MNCNKIERRINELFTGERIMELCDSPYSNPVAEIAYDNPDFFDYFDRQNNITFSSVIEDSFKILSRNYRTEYFYKNTIANKYFLQKANPSHSTYLNEFKVGNSIADIALLDRTSKVFEIKTELDSTERLISQLADYRNAFEEIYLVTSPKLINKYSTFLPSGVGIISITKRGAIKKIREASLNNTFDFNTLFNVLRKPEYTAITEYFYNTLPQVPDVYLFKACRRLLSKVDINEFYPVWKRTIKGRKIATLNLICSPKVPYGLKHWCLAKNLSEKKLNILIESLFCQIKNHQPLCTYRL